jgi:hypothetical protein
LVGASFFLPTRSFGSYLFMLVPAAIIAGVTVGPVPISWRPIPRRWLEPALLAGAGLAAGFALIAVLSPSPLSIRVVDTQSTGQLGTIDQATVQVVNRTGRTQHPHFTVEAQQHATTFWNAVDASGQPITATIAPHGVATFILRAPNTGSMPAVAAPMFIAAFTGSPAAMSTSDSYLVSRVSTEIIPDAVNSSIPVGQPIQLAVQLQDQYGNPVRRAGVTVLLGQVVYAYGGLLAGESSINGQGEGSSPVPANTDANGIAQFTIVGDEVQPQPVFYEAWIADSSTVPHGYSNQVSVQFRSR